MDEIDVRGLTVTVIRGEETQFRVAKGELKTPEEFADIVVASQGTQLVRLGDIARVELGPEARRSYLQFDGVPGVAVGVVCN